MNAYHTLIKYILLGRNRLAKKNIFRNKAFPPPPRPPPASPPLFPLCIIFDGRRAELFPLDALQSTELLAYIASQNGVQCLSCPKEICDSAFTVF